MKLILFLVVGVVCELKLPKQLITNSFDKRIGLEVLRVSPVNTVVSPLLLKFPLCRLASMSRAMAKFELMSAFGFPTEDYIKYCYAKYRQHFMRMKMQDFLTTTKIYINESLDVENGFIENSTDIFGVRVEKVGFKYSLAASEFINRAVERDMLKRVTNIIDPEDININTSMVILNGASFKATWETPFHAQLTKDKTFRNMKGDLWKIPMMVTMGDILFFDDPNLDVKMVTLNLIQEDITFVIPHNRDSLPSFIEKMTNNTNLFKEMKSQMKRKVLTISIPKFKIKTYVDWTGFLKLVGINQIMNTTYSGLHHILKPNTTSKIYLSKAKQKIFMELDEFGSRRFSETDNPREFERMVNFMDRGEELLLDKPFYFRVDFKMSSGSSDILLHGVYYGPYEI